MKQNMRIAVATAVLILSIVGAVFANLMVTKQWGNNVTIIASYNLGLFEADGVTPLPATHDWGTIVRGSLHTYMTITVRNTGDSKVWVMYRSDGLPSGVTLEWNKDTSGWSAWVSGNRYPLESGVAMHAQCYLNIDVTATPATLNFQIYIDGFDTA